MARRKRRRRNKVSDSATFAAVGGGLLAAAALWRILREHLVIVSVAAIVVVVAAGAMLYLHARLRWRLTDHERQVAVTDTMTGAEFEHYVAKLMRASGCRSVKVSGGSGDMGADVIARAPDGRRIVVQCKRYAGTLGSPHVQRFAGTARDIHGAEVAMLVTTGRPSAQAREVARRCRITLVDRGDLARWISTQQTPLSC